MKNQVDQESTSTPFERGVGLGPGCGRSHGSPGRIACSSRPFPKQFTLTRHVYCISVKSCSIRSSCLRLRSTWKNQTTKERSLPPAPAPLLGESRSKDPAGGEALSAHLAVLLGTLDLGLDLLRHLLLLAVEVLRVLGEGLLLRAVPVLVEAPAHLADQIILSSYLSNIW